MLVIFSAQGRIFQGIEFITVDMSGKEFSIMNVMKTISAISRFEHINQAHQPVVMRCPLVCFLIGLSL